MLQYIYLKLGYDAGKITKEDAITMLGEGGGVYPELLTLEEIKEIEEELLERLATLEHKRWMMWSKDVAQTAVIPSQRLECWIKMWVPYNQLTEEQKGYSRAWARELIRAMNKHGTAFTDPTIL